MMDEAYIERILSSTTADLVERNGAELLAGLFQAALRNYRDALRQAQHEQLQMAAQLTEAQKIGLRVMRASKDGRRVLRIDELQVAA